MRSSKVTHFKAQTPCSALVVFHTVRCGDYWCKIDGVYACTLLQNSPFCVISFHPCLFVLVFVSFFCIRSKYFFWFCNFMLSNPIIYRIIHAESGDMEFFYQSSTRYLSSGLNDFPHLASHVETSKNG